MAVTRKNLRIAIISDSRNYSIADTYFTLLKTGAFNGCQSHSLHFDPACPERVTEGMERLQIVLAHIGIPGRHDYARQMHAFLEAYAAVRRKPAAGIVTHDCDHTRYVIEKWLTGATRSPHHLPDGAVSIIDASRPLHSRTLEKALEILLSKMPPLPARGRHVIPFSQVTVDSYSFQPGETKMKA